MRVISETGCSASPDGDLLRNRWKPEDLLLEVFVFEMLSNSAEGDFRGCPCPYVHDTHESAELRLLQLGIWDFDSSQATMFSEVDSAAELCKANKVMF